jgi:hemerythrin-like domain-containing protein
MKIIHALLGEHGAMYPLLDLLEKQVSAAGLDIIKAQASLLESTLISHANIEDALLRPAIQEHLPPLARNADSTLAPTDHEVIGAGVRAVVAAQTVGDARRLLLDTLHKTRKHFAKEEQVIFRIADRELTEEVQNRLGAEWAARRTIGLPD